MEITVLNQQNIIEWSEELENFINHVIEAVGNTEDLAQEAEVSILLVDNPYIQELNNQYRGIDLPTDVLSFAMNETSGDLPDFEAWQDSWLLGDIVVSLEQALIQSKEYGHSFKRELGYLITHGMLHLLGYNHENREERSIMRTREEAIMKSIDLER
ncbi:MAG: rRNA maturation RNase YbeY [Syntrophomonadaceae bacterium]